MTNVIKKVKIFDTNLMSEVISSKNLSEAFQHVYKTRQKCHHNNDIWHLSQNWQDTKIHIQKSLLKQQYHLEPLKILNIKGEHISVWSARDAVVLKAISIVLSKHLNVKGLNNDVYHLAGNGGVPGAIRKVAEYTKLSYKNIKDTLLNSTNVNTNANAKSKTQTKTLTADNNKSNSNTETTDYKHVIKSDIKSFYSSTDHSVLLNECKKHIKDKKILNIIMQYAARLEDVRGEYVHITKGISRGCSLSPLMGAIVLKSLDSAMTKLKNVAYLRYMDDWVILTKTKAQHRKCIKIMHNVIKKLKFKLAIDKTFIGKIVRGFDFLGQRFVGSGVKPQSANQQNINK